MTSGVARLGRGVALSLLLLPGLLLGLSAAAAAVEAAPPPWPDVARQVSALLDDATRAYEAGSPEKAKDLVTEAYFGPFEAGGMEIAIRQQISARRARTLEKMFAKIRQAIGRGEPAGAVRERVATLEQALDHDAQALVRAGVTAVRLAETGEPAPVGEPAPAGAGVSPLGAAPDGLVNEIVARLDQARARYEAGDPDQAKALLGSAYFDLFEHQGLEAAVGARSFRLKADIEGRFARVRGLMSSGTPADRVGRELDALKGRIREAATLVTPGQGRAAAFLNGLIVIVREGFEAILILTALAAYLLKSGHGDKVRVVYQAGGVALAASLLAALLVQTLFRLSPRYQEALEGATMLLATAVLFYVSYWLTSRAEADRWAQYIRKRAQASLGTGSLVALWSAAFLAVFREGAETILFYQALLAGTGPGEAGAVVGGFGAGALVLVLVFILFRSGALRIPIRAFFTLTSALLYYLAFVFAGKGIQELQVSGLVGITPAHWVPTWEVVGLYPTWESVGLQLLLVGAAALALAYLFLIRGRGTRAAAAQG
jgi:high-affinity iron transporter